MPLVIPPTKRLLQPKTSHGVMSRTTSGRFYTNLILRSEDFTTNWTRGSVLAFGAGSVSNSISSPFGAVTADTITEDATAGVQHNMISNSVSGLLSTGVYAVSCFFKAKERTRGRIGFLDNATVDGAAVLFNLSTGQITSTTTFGAGVLLNSSISFYDNGWYRVSVSGILNNGKTQGLIYLNLLDASGAVTYNGDGTSGMYFFGAQLESGMFSTNYIPTTTTAVTREEP